MEKAMEEEQSRLGERMREMEARMKYTDNRVDRGFEGILGGIEREEEERRRELRGEVDWVRREVAAIRGIVENGQEEIGELKMQVEERIKRPESYAVQAEEKLEGNIGELKRQGEGMEKEIFNKKDLMGLKMRLLNVVHQLSKMEVEIEAIKRRGGRDGDEKAKLLEEEQMGEVQKELSMLSKEVSENKREMGSWLRATKCKIEMVMREIEEGTMLSKWLKKRVTALEGWQLDQMRKARGLVVASVQDESDGGKENGEDEDRTREDSREEEIKQREENEGGSAPVSVESVTSEDADSGSIDDKGKKPQVKHDKKCKRDPEPTAVLLVGEILEHLTHIVFAIGMFVCLWKFVEVYK